MRWFAQNGKLRFTVRSIELPAGSEQQAIEHTVNSLMTAAEAAPGQGVSFARQTEALRLRRVILNALVAEGHCVVETAHYNHALQILRKTHPDLALVDFDTKQNTCLDLCREMQSASDAPIFIFAAQHCNWQPLQMLQRSITCAEIIDRKINSHGGKFLHACGNLVKIQDHSLRDLHLQQCRVDTRLQDGTLHLCSKSLRINCRGDTLTAILTGVIPALFQSVNCRQASSITKFPRG